MRFFKYEGLGNDFILIPKKPFLSVSQIQRLCNRHKGIGADGILFVFEEAGFWHMRVANADGSVPEMCGNGIRCVAQWLVDQGHDVCKIQTDAGLKTCTPSPKPFPASGRGSTNYWSVDMGIAQIHDNRVSMGNPHLVIQGPVDTNQIDPSVNTEFVQIHTPNEITVHVFERGVGETEACGTGACASVAWLVSQKLGFENQEITVHLKGGNLYITARHTKQGLQIQMKGPAKKVFEGEVYKDEHF